MTTSTTSTTVSSRLSAFNNTAKVTDYDLQPSTSSKEPILDERTHENFLDDYLYHVLSIILWLALQIPVTAFGVGTNCLNIIIFRMAGLRDSVSITYTALSISDLGYVVVFLFLRLIGLVVLVFNTKTAGKFGLGELAYYVSYFGVLFQDISVLITVFVVVQKCCCVAIPHLFKNVFNSTRTVTILVCLSLGMTSCYIPVLAGMRFIVITLRPISNETFYKLHFTPLFFKGANFWKVFSKIILPVSSQGITIICLLIMAVKLKKSVEFRSSDNKSDTQLGEKEKRVIISVAIVSIMFVVASVPATILNYAQLLATTFFNDPRNRTFTALLNNCQNSLIHISASVNIFVYFKYNSKFQKTAVTLFNRILCCAYLGTDNGKQRNKEPNKGEN